MHIAHCLQAHIKSTTNYRNSKQIFLCLESLTLDPLENNPIFVSCTCMCVRGLAVYIHINNNTHPNKSTQNTLYRSPGSNVPPPSGEQSNNRRINPLNASGSRITNEFMVGSRPPLNQYGSQVTAVSKDLLGTSTVCSRVDRDSVQ